MPNHTIKVGGLIEYNGSEEQYQNKIATVREQLRANENPKYRVQFKEDNEELIVNETEIKPL